MDEDDVVYSTDSAEHEENLNPSLAQDWQEDGEDWEDY